MALKYIQNKARGDMELVSMGYFLPNNGSSPKAYDESVLENNAEIQNLLSKNLIALVDRPVSVPQPKPVVSQPRVVAPNQIDVPDLETAVENDSQEMVNEQIQAYVQQAKTALDRLAEIVEQTNKVVAVKKVEVKAPPKDGQFKFTDELDLPMNAPFGLQPQSFTADYLKKNKAGRKKVLKTCLDIGLLKDISLFENDVELKQMARQAAISAERFAESSQKSVTA